MSLPTNPQPNLAAIHHRHPHSPQAKSEQEIQIFFHPAIKGKNLDRLMRELGW